VSSDTKYPSGFDSRPDQRPVACYVTYTTDATAEIIRATCTKSPMYSGVIEGVGQGIGRRLKIKSSSSRTRNGSRFFSNPRELPPTKSTSTASQPACLTRFKCLGPNHHRLRKCDIMRPAYAVEYDFAFPTQLHPRGDEESAAIFFWPDKSTALPLRRSRRSRSHAGINAVRRIQNRSPVFSAATSLHRRADCDFGSPKARWSRIGCSLPGRVSVAPPPGQADLR